MTSPSTSEQRVCRLMGLAVIRYIKLKLETLIANVSFISADFSVSKLIHTITWRS